LALFTRLNAELGVAILYISHDLLSVTSLCHRIAILHGGEIVEFGTPAVIFDSPRHPYARRLIAALPQNPHHRTMDESPTGFGGDLISSNVLYHK
jgi:peptide/nickel transport system ATP-binding protein